VRAALDRIADECGLAEADRFDLKVAATEAVTNALNAAADDEQVEVRIACRDESVDLEVSAPAPFSAWQTAGEDRLEGEGGRGIPLMISLVDHVEFARTRAGSRVRLRKRRRGARPARRGSYIRRAPT
jgi:anti-sigma regulatory factor (Ser/Thr protein kinase)